MTARTNHDLNTHCNILALDAAYGNIAACIIRNKRRYILQANKHNTGTTRSNAIIPAINSLLEQAGINWNQLDVLAMGAGPGSFTGLRIAAATLAGINAALHLPIIHISSLAITARQSDSPELVRVLEDARAGELFCGLYQHGNAVEADRCLRWIQIKSLPPGLFCCLNEPPLSLDLWRRLPPAITRSLALALETHAACDKVSDWHGMPLYPSPIYLQPSQAERHLPRTIHE